MNDKASRETVIVGNFNDIKAQIKQLLSDVYAINVTEDYWICDITLMQVVASVEASHRDMRNHYNSGISILKHIALIASWLIKLKPLNNVELYKRGSLVKVPDINERIAICLAMKLVADAVISGKLSEIVTPTERNIGYLREIIKYYYHGDLYRKIDGTTGVGDSQKVSELIHNFRFKKFTSINIYEILVHLIIPFKVIGTQDAK